ncbi:hypothetical protein RCL_jg3157.t1 [Rhizophagus clarus]|uniref:Uncharacterized protein n=1 Tax=Rhizophagus clarus TaxID=94130 RepID=A0A8H3MC34_9GLOM|nr:hypothetical protein RCL_jg3157.t1 [Rhizophagus clarus]
MEFDDNSKPILFLNKYLYLRAKNRCSDENHSLLMRQSGGEVQDKKRLFQFDDIHSPKNIVLEYSLLRRSQKSSKLTGFLKIVLLEIFLKDQLTLKPVLNYI